MSRREELIKLMDDHKLTAAQVAEMLGREATTVRFWRSNGGRHIPKDALELLKAKVAPK
jgi:hypothetical protein